MSYRKWSDSDLKVAVKNNNRMSGVIRDLGFTTLGTAIGNAHESH